MFQLLFLTMIIVQEPKSGIATQLDALQSVYDQIIDEQHRVDYAALKNNPARRQTLKDYAAMMATFDGATQPPSVQLALYANAYNVFTLLGVIQAYPIKSVTEIAPDYGFFSQKRWNINGSMHSLNDLEKTWLRPLDPKIHFIINCASKSCPPLLKEVLRPETIQRQMDQATIAFLKNPQANQIHKDRWQLSKIFEWYAADWGGSAETHEFIRKTLGLERIPKRITYLEYDWQLNDQP